MVAAFCDISNADRLSAQASQPINNAPCIGAPVGPLTKLLALGQGSTGLGRVGGFVVSKMARDTSEVFALSAHHVLDEQPGTAIYQPALTDGPNGLLLHNTALNPIGQISGEGASTTHVFAYPGETQKPYYVDCALVRIDDFPISFEPVKAGRAHPLDIAGNRELLVRMAGVHERPAGRIVNVDASIQREDGETCAGTLVIESLPDRPPFASEGDSGALVVDQHDRALGLLWGVDLNQPRRAFACHLLPALDYLNMVMLNCPSPNIKKREVVHGGA